MCPRPKPEVLHIPYWGMINAGEVMDESGLLPTVEASAYIAIYAVRPDVNAIVHSHAVWLSTFAVTGKSVPLI